MLFLRIKKYVGDTDNLIHIFEESDEKFFHKTRILNDLCCAAETPIIYNHDVDVVLPRIVTNLHTTLLLKKDHMLFILLDVVSINEAVTYSDELLDKFLSSHDGNDFDLESSQG